MRATMLKVLLTGAAAALSACNEKQNDQNIAITDNLPANADIEALPADESSATPTNDLATGTDNADATDLNAANNAY